MSITFKSLYWTTAVCLLTLIGNWDLAVAQKGGTNNKPTQGPESQAKLLDQLGFHLEDGLPVLAGMKESASSVSYYRTISIGDFMALDRLYDLIELKHNEKNYFERFKDRASRKSVINRFMKNGAGKYSVSRRDSDLIANKRWQDFLNEHGNDLQEYASKITLPIDFLVVQSVAPDKYDTSVGGYKLRNEDQPIQFSFTPSGLGGYVHTLSSVDIPNEWPISKENASNFESNYSRRQLVLVHRVRLRLANDSDKIVSKSAISKRNEEFDYSTPELSAELLSTTLHKVGEPPAKFRKHLWPGELLHEFDQKALDGNVDTGALIKGNKDFFGLKYFVGNKPILLMDQGYKSTHRLFLGKLADMLAINSDESFATSNQQDLIRRFLTEDVAPYMMAGQMHPEVNADKIPQELTRLKKLSKSVNLPIEFVMVWDDYRSKVGEFDPKLGGFLFRRSSIARAGRVSNFMVNGNELMLCLDPTGLDKMVPVIAKEFELPEFVPATESNQDAIEKRIPRHRRVQLFIHVQLSKGKEKPRFLISKQGKVLQDEPVTETGLPLLELKVLSCELHSGNVQLKAQTELNDKTLIYKF